MSADRKVKAKKTKTDEKVKAKKTKTDEKVKAKKTKTDEKVEPGAKSNGIERILALRKAIKKKRPKAQRQESWRYGRVHDNWRRPRGIDSKMRLNAKGWPTVVNVGRRGPKATRGLHPSGKREVMVYSTSELERIVGSEQVARIGGQVGSRSREKIVARANELGIRILNPQRTRISKPTE